MADYRELASPTVAVVSVKKSGSKQEEAEEATFFSSTSKVFENMFNCQSMNATNLFDFVLKQNERVSCDRVFDLQSSLCVGHPELEYHYLDSSDGRQGPDENCESDGEHADGPSATSLVDKDLTDNLQSKGADNSSEQQAQQQQPKSIVVDCTGTSVVPASSQPTEQDGSVSNNNNTKSGVFSQNIDSHQEYISSTFSSRILHDIQRKNSKNSSAIISTSSKSTTTGGEGFVYTEEHRMRYDSSPTETNTIPLEGQPHSSCQDAAVDAVTPACMMFEGCSSNSSEAVPFQPPLMQQEQQNSHPSQSNMGVLSSLDSNMDGDSELLNKISFTATTVWIRPTAFGSVHKVVSDEDTGNDSSSTNSDDLRDSVEEASSSVTRNSSAIHRAVRGKHSCLAELKGVAHDAWQWEEKYTKNSIDFNSKEENLDNDETEKNGGPVNKETSSSMEQRGDVENYQGDIHSGHHHYCEDTDDICYDGDKDEDEGSIPGSADNWSPHRDADDDEASCVISIDDITANQEEDETQDKEFEILEDTTVRENAELVHDSYQGAIPHESTSEEEANDLLTTLEKEAFLNREKTGNNAKQVNEMLYEQSCRSGQGEDNNSAENQASTAVASSTYERQEIEKFTIHESFSEETSHCQTITNNDQAIYNRDPSPPTSASVASTSNIDYISEDTDDLQTNGNFWVQSWRSCLSNDQNAKDVTITTTATTTTTATAQEDSNDGPIGESFLPPFCDSNVQGTPNHDPFAMLAAVSNQEFISDGPDDLQVSDSSSQQSWRNENQLNKEKGATATNVNDLFEGDFDCAPIGESLLQQSSPSDRSSCDDIVAEEASTSSSSQTKGNQPSFSTWQKSSDAEPNRLSAEYNTATPRDQLESETKTHSKERNAYFLKNYPAHGVFPEKACFTEPSGEGVIGDVSPASPSTVATASATTCQNPEDPDDLPISESLLEQAWQSWSAEEKMEDKTDNDQNKTNDEAEDQDPDFFTGRFPSDETSVSISMEYSATTNSIPSSSSSMSTWDVNATQITAQKNIKNDGTELEHVSPPTTSDSANAKSEVITELEHVSPSTTSNHSAHAKSEVIETMKHRDLPQGQVHNPLSTQQTQAAARGIQLWWYRMRYRRKSRMLAASILQKTLTGRNQQKNKLSVSPCSNRGLDNSIGPRTSFAQSTWTSIEELSSFRAFAQQHAERILEQCQRGSQKERENFPHITNETSSWDSDDSNGSPHTSDDTSEQGKYSRFMTMLD